MKSRRKASSRGEPIGVVAGDQQLAWARTAAPRGPALRRKVETSTVLPSWKYTCTSRKRRPMIRELLNNWRIFTRLRVGTDVEVWPAAQHQVAHAPPHHVGQISGVVEAVNLESVEPMFAEMDGRTARRSAAPRSLRSQGDYMETDGNGAPRPQITPGLGVDARKRKPGRAEGLVPAPAPEGEEFCLSGPVAQDHRADFLEVNGLVVVVHCLLPQVPDWLVSGLQIHDPCQGEEEGVGFILSGLRRGRQRCEEGASPGGDRARVEAGIWRGRGPPTPAASPRRSRPSVSRTGHLSAISRSLARCSGVRGPRTLDDPLAHRLGSTPRNSARALAASGTLSNHISSM